MSTRKEIRWVTRLALVLLLSSLPSIGYADWEDVISQFRPRITVQEDYTNNLNLTSTGKVEDFITTVSPGLTLFATDRREPRYGVDLNYQLGFVSFAHNSQDNYVSHTGILNTWYTFDPKLTFRLSDYFIRSDEPLAAMVTGQAMPGTYSGTLGQPGVSYLGAPTGTYYLGTQPGAYYLGAQT